MMNIYQGLKFVYSLHYAICTLNCWAAFLSVVIECGKLCIFNSQKHPEVREKQPKSTFKI